MPSINDQIKNDIYNALIQINPEWGSESASVDYPTKLGFGDLTTNVAFTLGKENKQKPMEIANKIKEELSKNKNLTDLVSIEVAPPGFINFTLNNQTIWQEFLASVSETNHQQHNLSKEKILVEYSSPNIAKPFNVGHLRSTIIGDSLARMYKYLGAEVITDNHLGDWGTQYGKLAYAVEQWGDWSAIKANPIPELFQLYVKFHQLEADNPDLTEKGREYFKQLEQGDPNTKKLWQNLVEVSLKDFDQLYQQLDVHFDLQHGESFYEDKLSETIKECQTSGIAKESEGALLIFFPNEELPPLMIRKSNGTSTYATRDLAGIKYRLNHYNLTKLVIEIGNEQKLYFQQVIKASQLLGWTKPGQVIHVGHGLFILPTGKMSTRRGETVWLKDLIEELYQKSLEITQQKSPQLPADQQQAIAHTIAIGALKYNDLSQNRNSNVVFDKEKSLSLDGNSAPYLQYTVARAKSVLRLATTDTQAIQAHQAALSNLTHAERTVLAQAIKWHDTIVESANTYLPSHLAGYLFQLAQTFNLFYHTDPILQADPEVRDRRLVLTSGVANLLESGLGLLGIKIPERM